MYNVKSMQASEFIAHDEILETLAYASANKNNASLIDSIIAKAKERKGLSHREAAVLLDCELDEKIRKFCFGRTDQKDFTATASLCLRRYIFQTTVLTAAFIALITV